MASRVPNGFTLIELLVVVGIVMLIAGGAVANFNRYYEDQKVRQAAATLKNTLRFAQQQAISGNKPANGCTNLLGFRVLVGETAYTIQAYCGEGAAGERSTVSLPAGVSFSPVPSSPITFRALDGSVDNPATLTLVGQSLGARMTVTAGGTIIDEGTFQP